MSGRRGRFLSGIGPNGAVPAVWGFGMQFTRPSMHRVCQTIKGCAAVWIAIGLAGEGAVWMVQNGWQLPLGIFFSRHTMRILEPVLGAGVFSMMAVGLLSLLVSVTCWCGRRASVHDVIHSCALLSVSVACLYMLPSTYR